MADTIAITAGTGTTVATDDIGGVHYQRIKVGLGADGTAVDMVGGTGVDGTGVPRVTLATNVGLPAGTNAIGKVKVTNDAGTVIDPVAAVGGGVPVVSGGYEYETVAASQTGQTLGATGATGDYISGILVVPATTSPGNVLLLDNATSITVFTGGASSVSNLVPFFIPLGLISVSGAWKITTGANVSCIGCGNFTA